ncbi:T9SS type A sorting domain-containing protein [Persicitalea jodogahamensis]|uniref:Secretion system C-terminal sorting domain-containing protein n=1 Tax=Persicitalea jodogahamensis TaxID=402147 RepID=A0A8J3D9Y9_9BACT|nr:T9SS type A sorting domain-containing protein [Persicitalea jodogahamensis]GHB73965.1 hypothetical protein GCM10007390_30260 [Persicitalea jodogahamensis]
MSNRFLKLVRLTLLLAALGFYQNSFGQLDPQLTAYQIAPNPIQATNFAQAQLTFAMAGQAGTVPAGGIVIQVSFPTAYLPYDPAGPAGTSPTIAQTNPLFTFTYDVGLRTVTATSSVPIVAGDGTTISITLYGAAETAANPQTNANFQNPAPVAGDAVGNNAIATSANVTAAPSPVLLSSFSAQKEAQTALLSWSTAEEINSDRFEVEHSLNGKNWRMIGKVAAEGNSKNTQWYSFTDVNPANGSNLYRLRMVDRDGTFDYSRIKSLEFDINIETALYPNPVAERLLLKTDDLSKISRVELYNAMGVAVIHTESVSDTGLDVKSLPTGLYVVKVTRTNGSTDTFKVLKQ